MICIHKNTLKIEFLERKHCNNWILFLHIIQFNSKSTNNTIKKTIQIIKTEMIAQSI